MEVNGIEIDFSELLTPSNPVQPLGRGPNKNKYISRAKRESVPDKIVGTILHTYAGYVCAIGNLNYTLSDASFDCKGHRSKYVYDPVYRGYIRVIRNLESMGYSDKAYRPFKEGQRVTGRIIMEDGIEKFDMLVNHIDYTDELSQNVQYFAMAELHDKAKRVN